MECLRSKPTMAIRVVLFLGILAMALSMVLVQADHNDSVPFNRYRFPKVFVFGTASSSYQIEGGANEGGRGPSIWDTFTHQHPGLPTICSDTPVYGFVYKYANGSLMIYVGSTEKITDHSNGDVAVDSYHLYKEDVKIMKKMNVDTYRFSISWSRLIPNGKRKDRVNQEGINYYNNLINELLSKGVQPYVTLYHWDCPQHLEDEYNGFLSPHVVRDFQDYAEVCFKEFGDRVKHWITLNEPWTFASNGYALGIHAPGRCSKFIGNCTAGNSATEPYIVAHNQLLAHAAAVKVYKDRYQRYQKGQIGITLLTHWMVPLSESKADKDAAHRALDFMFGWFMDPLVNGDYPKSMISLVGNRLPRFSKEQSKLVKGSFDFIGLNYYTANYASHAPPSNNPPSYQVDSRAKLTTEKNGIPIGAQAGSTWLFVYPKGIRDVLVYTKEKYNNPTIYITENGRSEKDNSTLSLKEALKDSARIYYYSRHLLSVLQAINEGVDVRGYFGWSLLDNFEWADGYTMRFGIHYVDYKNGLKRYPKQSAIWFRKFLAR